MNKKSVQYIGGNYVSVPLSRILVSLSLIVFTFSSPAAGGNLDAPAAPGNPISGMYTVKDVYSRLNTGTSNSKRTGAFTEPAAAPGNSSRPTLDNLMSIAPAADNTNGVTASEIPCGKTFWGLRTDGGWGLQTGTFGCSPKGTVIDPNTKLMWQQKDDNITRTWAGAGTYCSNLTLPASGYSDWRLPTIQEAKDKVKFPNTNSSEYWSSTAYAFSSPLAWSFFFNSSYVGLSSKSNSNYVRCVRAGQ